MSIPDYIGRIEGIELEAYRSVSAKKEALEINPRAFSRDESIEICQSYYEATAAIIERHPEWELAEYPAINCSPDSGCVFASTEFD